MSFCFSADPGRRGRSRLRCERSGSPGILRGRSFSGDIYCSCPLPLHLLQEVLILPGFNDLHCHLFRLRSWAKLVRVALPQPASHSHVDSVAVLQNDQARPNPPSSLSSSSHSPHQDPLTCRPGTVSVQWWSGCLSDLLFARGFHSQFDDSSCTRMLPNLLRWDHKGCRPSPGYAVRHLTEALPEDGDFSHMPYTS